MPKISGPVNAPMFSVIAGGVMISFSAVFAKLTTVGPDTAAFYRGLFGGLALLILALFRREVRLPSKALLAPILGAALCLALDLISWHRSIAEVGPGLATILINFQVFFLAFAGRLWLGEPLPGRLWAAVPLALSGLWLLVGLDLGSLGKGVFSGTLLGLVAAIWFGGYTLLVRLSQTGDRTLPPIFNMAMISLAAALVLGAICLSTDRSLAIETAWDAIWLALYGLVSQGLGWLLISRGLPHVPAFAAGMAILIMPTLSFIWDIVIFGRDTGPLSFLGAAMALAAIRLGVGHSKPASNLVEDIGIKTLKQTRP